MDNEVSITIRARDETRAAFDSVNRTARSIGDNVRNMFGRMGENMRSFGDRSGNLFSKIGQGVKKVWEFAGSAGEKVMALGQKVSEFADTPQAKLAMLVGAISVLPVIASTAAAAITIGLGGAILGIGVAAAAQDVKVRKAFSNLKESVTKDLQQMAEPLEPVLINAAGKIRSTFDSLAPYLQRAFANLAPALDEFIGRVSDGFKSWGPMIGFVAQEFKPLLNVLGSELQTMLEHLAARFAGLADAADPKFLSGLISGFTMFMDVVLVTIENLARIGSAITWLVDLIPGINFDDGSSSARSFGEAVGETSNKVFNASDAVDALTGKLRELAGQFLGMRGAARNYEAAIDDASDAIRKNGRTLDINTKAGRANEEALDSVAASALDLADKMEKSGEDSSKVLARGRRDFIRLAMAAGESRQSAERLADQAGLLAVQIRKIPGDKKTTFTNNARQAAERIREIQQALAQIPRNITTTITTNHVGKGGKASGGVVGTAATGGARANLTLVGEQGPELVRLPVGSQVIPNGQTEQMMSSGSRSGTPLVVQLIVGDRELGEILIDPIRKTVSARGGNVQAVLGR